MLPCSSQPHTLMTGQTHFNKSTFKKAIFSIFMEEMAARNIAVFDGVGGHFRTCLI